MPSRFSTAKLCLVAFLALCVLAAVTACSLVGKTYRTILTGKSINLSTLEVTQLGDKIQIGFRLNEEGTKTFTDYTDKHVGQYVAITLDKKVLTCPKILQPIRGGGVAIERQSTIEEAEQTADEIRRDPGRLEFIEAGAAPLALGETIQTTGTP